MGLNTGGADNTVLASPQIGAAVNKNYPASSAVAALASAPMAVSSIP